MADNSGIEVVNNLAASYAPSPDTASAPATPAATPATPDSWLSQIEDAELRGHIANRGWDKLSPVEAALQAIKAHKNAETMMRAPADQLLRLPKADDPEAVRNFWQKLGAPADAADYKFEGIDNPALTETLRKLGSDTNMPADMLQKVARHLVDFTDGQNAAAAEQKTITMGAEQRELESSWGPKDGVRFGINMRIANQAAEAVGLTQEDVETMAAAIGPAKFSKVFHKIGVDMGEDKTAITNSSNAPITTREQAVSKLADLKRDRAWGDKLLKGDPIAKKEFQALTNIIGGAA